MCAQKSKRHVEPVYVEELSRNSSGLSFYIVRLASSLKEKQSEFIKRNMLGYPWIKIPDSVFQKKSDKDKIEEFWKAAASEHRNIWAVKGGYGAYRLIENLEKNKSKFAHLENKTFIGYSDLTAMNLFLSQNTKWKVIHGPMFAELLDYAQKRKSIQVLLDLLSKNISYKFKVNRFSNGGNNAATTKIKAPITGGNLTLIECSLKTKWEIDTKGKIVFVEDVNVTPEMFYRSMYHLYEAGKFKNIKALVIGTMNRRVLSKDFLDVVRKLSKRITAPIFITDKIGHGKYNFPIVYNSKTKIENGYIFLNCK